MVTKIPLPNSATLISCALLATGMALAAAACSSSSGTASTKATTPATTTPTLHVSHAAAYNNANADGAARGLPLAPPPNNATSRNQRGFDPFWVEASTQPNQARMTDRYAFASPTTSTFASDSNSAFPHTPVATNAGPTEEGIEGLTHVTLAPEGADFDPCVSRDGSFMVFASTQHRPTADIYSKSMNGRTITQLTSDPAHDVMPSISPDGQRIAFASNRNGNWDIFVMSASGGQAVQLTTDTTHEVHPSWSPDGSRIVFCRLGEISGRWELWVMDVNGTSAAEFVGYGLFPRWCTKAGTGEHGRDKIMFQRSRERGGRAFSIWTIDYKPGDASSPTEIASSQTAASINPCWSPDGKYIVFSTVESSGRETGDDWTHHATNSDLWMTGIDGSNRVNLTAGRFMNLMPWWASDGRIYFVSDRTNTPNIWSIGTEKAVAAACGNKVNPTTTTTTNTTNTTNMTTPPQTKTEAATVPEGHATPHD